MAPRVSCEVARVRVRLEQSGKASADPRQAEEGAGALGAWAAPQTLRAHRETLWRLGEVYKQLNAPFGQFGMDTLVISTRAVKSGTADDDSTYTVLENQLMSFTDQGDALAGQMRSMLAASAFAGQPLDAGQAHILISEAEILLDQVQLLPDNLDGSVRRIPKATR